ncbi:uncharacterized protein LOC126975038 isoform X2 [Leptidea sinapis]|uniref:uncharacterized protein LOC126975038 isoform X2 n=1 Tax=Leptidea sinapis TaxID=189913 RepID=UPI0021C42448|nr:uncharacterized protein LOC126975038 isoform X2 [Leptidea sinapis]
MHDRVTESLSNRDVPSFIEARPPLITNPFMRPRPEKGRNLMDLFEEESEFEESDLVQVYLRVKPCNKPNNLYDVRSDRCLVTSLDTTTAGHGRRTQHNVSKMYTFSHIFGPDTDQGEIFEHVVKDNLKKLLEGRSFTLLTYGASGSGKTFTLMGTVLSPGLVPRSLEYVFKIINAAQYPVYKPAEGGGDKLNVSQQVYELQWVKKLRKVSIAPLKDKYRRMSTQLSSNMTISNLDITNDSNYFVWVSFIEIYNEKIYDLLTISERRNTSNLAIREDSNGNVYVKGATQAFVRSGEEAYDVMVAGKLNLQVAATGVHAESSRSHCIFTITLLKETDGSCVSSSVRLCDLAGCERARRTRNTGTRMQESRAINSSLHVLERCLHMLRRKQNCSRALLVPYRESKLTRLLGTGLSGSRGEAVSMVVTLNPAIEYAQENKHVLQLAAVAKDIQMNNTTYEYPSSLEDTRDTSTYNYDEEIMRLRAENERLHFESIHAKRLYEEQLASMEASLMENADTTRELVNKAREATTQFYVAEINRLKEKMEKLTEEYECQLSKLRSELTSPVDCKDTRLAREIAILQEEVNAERLARKRAEAEAEHLRACLAERDENEEKERTGSDLSDTNSEEEVDDNINESLEPTFHKDEINRSRLVRQSIMNESCADSSDNSDVLEISSDTIKEHSFNDCAFAVSEHIISTCKKICGDKTFDANQTSQNSFEESELVKTYNNESCYDDQVVEVEPNLGEKSGEEEQRDVQNQTSQNSFEESELVKTYNNESCYDDQVVEVEPNLGEKSGEEEQRDVQRSVSDSFCNEPIAVLGNRPDDILCNSREEVINDINTKEIGEKRQTFVKNDVNSLNFVPDNSNTSLATFEQLEIATMDSGQTAASYEFNTVNNGNKNRHFFDDNNGQTQNNVTNEGKKLYFENIQEIIETDVNKQQDDYRSPSIVKDEVPTDYQPSMIKKLLAKSLKTCRDAPGPQPIQKINNSRASDGSVDIFECFDSPSQDLEEKITDVETVGKSIACIDIVEEKEMCVDNFDTLTTIKKSEAEELFKVPIVVRKSAKVIDDDQKVKNVIEKTAKDLDVTIPNSEISQQNMTANNTLEQFENIYKDVTIPRVTEFENLVSDSHETIDDDIKQPSAIKYNLRKKSQMKLKNEELRDLKEDNKGVDEVLLQSESKCASKSRTSKRNLRLRRRNNVTSEECNSNGEDQLKDIVNLQSEFCDVTMGKPAPEKVVTDIKSPEKPQDENMPPNVELQSISKSRRKLFTPRADPLEENISQGGDSSERVRVPRPSYHRPRARRKL